MKMKMKKPEPKNEGKKHEKSESKTKEKSEDMTYKKPMKKKGK